MAAGYLIGINLVAFLAFVVDKRRAQTGAWRLTERSLLALAAIGGGIGAITAQQAVRHKTRKQPFATILWLIATAQALAFVVYLAM